MTVSYFLPCTRFIFPIPMNFEDFVDKLKLELRIFDIEALFGKKYPYYDIRKWTPFFPWSEPRRALIFTPPPRNWDCSVVVIRDRSHLGAIEVTVRLPFFYLLLVLLWPAIFTLLQLTVDGARPLTVGAVSPFILISLIQYLLFVISMREQTNSRILTQIRRLSEGRAHGAQ
ncbi:MAG: hypothetical protein JNM27_21395 [Leptospirales bacterium]|nr:hypothetical protein [Leptospirales bacterium]